MIDDIIIIDNVIPKVYQDLIENNLLGEMHSHWLLLDDISYGHDHVTGMSNPGLVHPLKVDNQIKSPLFNLVLPMVLLALDRAGWKYTDTVMARSFLQFPKDVSTPNNSHIDLEMPHVVCLYYVNDCDGPTIIYEPGSNNIKKIIDPQKGKAVVFDGKYYHSSSNPTTTRRCIINFDIV
jgi:hypothetical protein